MKLKFVKEVSEPNVNEADIKKSLKRILVRRDLERDHIFPRSLLLHAKIPEELIDNVGNLRLINKTRNILKSDKLPDEDTEFFGSNNPELKQLFLRVRENLTEQNFRRFVQKREFNKVETFLELERAP